MIAESDAVDFLCTLGDSSVQLIWTDPPFGTDGFQSSSSGARYRDLTVGKVVSMMEEVAWQAKRVLTDDGVLAVCLDYRAVHQVYCAVVEQGLLPQGEIVWTFGLGRGASKWWANKHNTILLFSKTESPRFYPERVPTTVRRAPKPGYEGDKKVASVWDYTLSNSASERVGYPNQKPEALIAPFVLVHTDEGDLVVDPFGGSGSTAAVAKSLNRLYATSDINPEAVAVMRRRLGLVD